MRLSPEIPATVMERNTVNVRDFYACHSEITDPCEYAPLMSDLPSGISDLVRTVQGLVLHIHWADQYGFSPDKERMKEESLRKVCRQLATMAALDSRPLTEPRPVERRLLGTCRDFTVLLCSMLRSQGVPARARCGFATYGDTERYHDHWVCEYHNEPAGRWVLVDAQIDELQRTTIGIEFEPMEFDTLDLPEGQFISGGQAWRMCRAGNANPERFGFFPTRHGLWFVKGSLVRDMLALNKLELLPWDTNGFTGDYAQHDVLDDDLPLLDRMAEAVVEGTFADIRAMFEEENGLRMPSSWQP